MVVVESAEGDAEEEVDVAVVVEVEREGAVKGEEYHWERNP